MHPLSDTVIDRIRQDFAVQIFDGEREGAVYEISPRADEFRVVLLFEFAQRKIGISFFRTVCDKKVTDGIGVIFFDQILRPDSMVSACRYFLPVQCDIFTGDDIVGQTQTAAVRQ